MVFARFSRGWKRVDRVLFPPGQPIPVLTLAVPSFFIGCAVEYGMIHMNIRGHNFCKYMTVLYCNSYVNF